MGFTSIFAYIDAGTGSMMLQALIAGFFAVVFFFSQIKRWVLARLTVQKKNPDEK
jgi:hypothetical protein